MEVEADIDPEKPLVDLQQQQQDMLAKSAAITEAFDQEQLYQLSNDIEKFNELYKQYRNAYFIRIAALSIFFIGMIFLILSFSLYFSDIQNARNEYETCIKENTWSKWKSSNKEGYLQRERCKSIQYTIKECPNTCTFDKGIYQTTEQPSMENFAICKNENSINIYVRINNP
uniref:Uncharacterized protein n=1 Tax=Panagrolaimus davidi TaxID=227884 RepID=A0A914QKN0_9BILA